VISQKKLWQREEFIVSALLTDNSLLDQRFAKYFALCGPFEAFFHDHACSARRSAAHDPSVHPSNVKKMDRLSGYLMGKLTARDLAAKRYPVSGDD
jgi:hypothetical protein